MAQIQNDRSVLRIPMGGWKDGLFDFCRFGPFHPSLVCASCCPLGKCIRGWVVGCHCVHVCFECFLCYTQTTIKEPSMNQ